MDKKIEEQLNLMGFKLNADYLEDPALKEILVPNVLKFEKKKETNIGLSLVFSLRIAGVFLDELTGILMFDVDIVKSESENEVPYQMFHFYTEKTSLTVENVLAFVRESIEKAGKSLETLVISMNEFRMLGM